MSTKLSFSKTKEHHKWKVIGFKGLWNECVFLPISLLNSLSMVASRKSLSEQEIKEIHRISVNQPRKPEFYEQQPRIKQCTSITLDKSSCLHLGIRSMMFLSIICGTLSLFLGFASVMNDTTIRVLTQSHPFNHRFQYRNAMAILAGVTACLSGTLSLIGCWWFTLKSSSHFFVPSYQNHHDESGAVFIWGSPLLVAIGSGCTYVFGGILLGIHIPKFCSVSCRTTSAGARETIQQQTWQSGSDKLFLQTQC